MEKFQPPQKKPQSTTSLMSPVGRCALRSISTKDNGAMRPVCTNPKLNADGNNWGANSCYDIRLDKDECPFVEGE